MSEEEKTIIDKSLCVSQANELLRGKQEELTLLEAKIIRLAIAQVMKLDTDLKTFTVKVSDLVRFLDIRSKNIYNEINSLTTDLLKKIIYVRDSKKNKAGEYNYIKFHWVSMAVYKDAYLTLKLSDEIKPYLVGLNELFTCYEYKEIISLPTTYSIRLFELLASYRNMLVRPYIPPTFIPTDKDEIIFTIEYLKDFLGCANKYENNGDFIIKVIKPSINSINKASIPFFYSYRTVKDGKTLKYVVFKIQMLGKDGTQFDFYNQEV